jgi:hypothetical protein
MFPAPTRETNDNECHILFQNQKKETMQNAPPTNSPGTAHPNQQVTADSKSCYTVMYSNIGSPTAEISGMVHFKSNAFDKTILKI